MNKFVFFFIAFLVFTQVGVAQSTDTKTAIETARSFMNRGDNDNAILVLTRALQQDNKSLEIQKNIALAYYLKKDYGKAMEQIKPMVDRADADVMTFQIAGNIYKAVEELKECEKMYKKGIKLFPSSGPLYSEYGELLWARKDYAAITQWEKGIETDPSYSGNYYNAALFYYYTKDKVWSIVYGEIFVNMESLTERSVSMKKLIYDAYKEKLFADADLMKSEEKNTNPFSLAYLECMNKQSSLANSGINPEVLTMIRTRFILEWYAKYAEKYPVKLFDYQRQLLQSGMFDAYNQWLFGMVESLSAYDSWTKTHSEEYTAFNSFQKSRIFKIPAGQYYQSK
jgi:Tfp pilus assembly protein PilF